MVGVETIWELHTLTVINWTKIVLYTMANMMVIDKALYSYVV